MVDNDYNTIKPVESLQNIAGLTPIKRREERKRRQGPRSAGTQHLHADHKKKRESTEGGGLDKSAELENRSNNSADDEDDRHSIDYCA